MISEKAVARAGKSGWDERQPEPKRHAWKAGVVWGTSWWIRRRSWKRVLGGGGVRGGQGRQWKAMEGRGGEGSPRGQPDDGGVGGEVGSWGWGCGGQERPQTVVGVEASDVDGEGGAGLWGRGGGGGMMLLMLMK